MKLKESELKVFYSGAVNRELDDALEAVLEAFGYQRWASGWCGEDDVRDLAFEQATSKEKKNG